MDELWGIKSILDHVDDVAVVIVSEREEEILYCNYYVTMMTGAHAGNSIRKICPEYDLLLRQCKNSGTNSARLFAASTSLGKNKNVTMTRIVWQGGRKAFSFVVTPHVEDQDERDREFIFKAFGKSYISMYAVSIKDWKISMYIKPDKTKMDLYQPLDFDEWKRSSYFPLIHVEDLIGMKQYFEKDEILRQLEENNNCFSMQFRRKFGSEYRWTEFRFCRVEELTNNERIICTERDVQGEMTLNSIRRENELIMQSIANVYRSIYLLDRSTGEYETVKPDELLFGIPREGDYNNLMDIVEELIPDQKQKKDFREYFSLEALDQAFLSGNVNIGREYNSNLLQELGWMSIQVLRPPHIWNLENKCVITFMDITEHKRVEAERNEKNIVVDVLSSRYTAVFFANLEEGTFHSIRVPRKHAYVEKQFKNYGEALNFYISAYVLEEYRDLLRRLASSDTLLLEENEGNQKQEYLYRDIENRWIRLSIFRVPGDDSDREAIVAFEDYNDIMNQNSISLIYSSTMLADYDGMYEYDPESDTVFTLIYDGERLVRTVIGQPGRGMQTLKREHELHPDDADIFWAACSKETVINSVENGKTVSHLYIRCKMGDSYHMFMYGFHYFDDMGNKRVLIMARDADKEIM